jgi:hypothetical protein
MPPRVISMINLNDSGNPILPLARDVTLAAFMNAVVGPSSSATVVTSMTPMKLWVVNRRTVWLMTGNCVQFLGRYLSNAA